MSMRTSSLLLLLPLVACGEAQQPPATLEATRPPATRAASVERVACAQGEASLAPNCTIDREATQAGAIWTVRHPDGGFHRLLITSDEVSAADGAEPLRAVGDDVTIGGWRYRLPQR